MVVEPEAPPVALRRATMDDIPGMLAVDERVYPKTWSTRMLTEQITRSDRLHVVAAAEGRVIGHAGVLFPTDEAHISTIAVDPGWQRRTIGRNLLWLLFMAAWRRGCRAITLEVRAGNEAALALYRSFGMAPVGVRRGYYGDNGDDALVLWTPDLDGQYWERLASMDLDPELALSDELQRLIDDVARFRVVTDRSEGDDT